MKFDKKSHNKLSTVQVYDWGEEWLKTEDEVLAIEQDNEEGLSDDISDYTHPYSERVKI
jgi:hypothetical protein